MSLHASVRSFLKGYGSRYIDQLTYRDHWAMVVRKIGQQSIVYAEGYQSCDKCLYGNRWSRPVLLHTTVVLAAGHTLQCPQWKADETSRRRRRFCEQYEGYGDICSCKHFSSYGISYFQYVKSCNLYKCCISISLTLTLIQIEPEPDNCLPPGAPLTNFNDGGWGGDGGGGEVRQRFIFYTQKNHNFRICLPPKNHYFF